MPEPSALAALDARSREIFRRIVESFLTSGEPVGSRSLSRQLPMTLSPASIRNVMQDLEELGLIYAPHTSAGRLPTQGGLRFYVDALLEFGGLAEEERVRIERQARTAAEDSYENALTRTTTLLSDLTRGAGVVLTSKDDMRLRHIEFVRVEPEKALAVLVGEDGAVENRVLAIPSDVSASALIEASNYLNAHARGGTLAEARAKIERARDEARHEIDALASRAGRRGPRVLGRRRRRAAATDRARPGQSHRRLRTRGRSWSASGCCSPISRHRPTSSTFCTAPRTARA